MTKKRKTTPFARYSYDLRKQLRRTPFSKCRIAEIVGKPKTGYDVGSLHFKNLTSVARHYGVDYNTLYAKLQSKCNKGKPTSQIVCELICK